MNKVLSPGERLKQKLREGDLAVGVWVTLESPTVTEIAVHLGLDWICIDTEHGHLDYKEVLEHLRAASRSTVATLVRIPEIQEGMIKRVLDLGADGILVPQIRTAEEVEKAMAFAKYPPRGRRGIGGERATLWGKGLAEVRRANERTLVIPLIERVEAAQNLDSIMAVPDVDAFFFGPADYSASAGYPGEWEGPGVSQAILRTKDRLRSRGFACGITVTNVKDARARIGQGFKMIGLGADTGLLIRAITDMMAAVERKAAWGGPDE